MPRPAVMPAGLARAARERSRSTNGSSPEASLYEYQPTMMHTKTMVVDGVWSMFGSVNVDNRSLELNDDLNVVVHDADLASRVLEAFEADLQRARQLELDTWRNRPLLEGTRERIWGYFGEVF